MGRVIAAGKVPVVKWKRNFSFGADAATGDEVAVCVRAERVDYAASGPAGFHLPGKVESHSYIGGVLRTKLVLANGKELLVTGANPTSVYPDGCDVQVFWDPEAAPLVERITHG